MLMCCKFTSYQRLPFELLRENTLNAGLAGYIIAIYSSSTA